MSKYYSEKGFSAVEGLLIVLIIAAVAGLGFYVVSQKTGSTDEYNSAGTSRDAATKAALDPSKVGTVAGIEAVAEASANDDNSIETELEQESYNNALSDQAALQAVGDSINENNL